MHDGMFRPTAAPIGPAARKSTVQSSDAGQNGFQVAAGVNLR
jgi:hypothetical protein